MLLLRSKALRLGGRAITHAAAHLLNRFVLVLCHPADEIVQDAVRVPSTVLNERRSHHGNLRSGRLVSVDLAVLGATRRIGVTWSVRISLNWRALTCVRVAGHGAQSGLKGRCSNRWATGPRVHNMLQDQDLMNKSRLLSEKRQFARYRKAGRR